MPRTSTSPAKGGRGKVQSASPEVINKGTRAGGRHTPLSTKEKNTKNEKGKPLTRRSHDSLDSGKKKRNSEDEDEEDVTAGSQKRKNSSAESPGPNNKKAKSTDSQKRKQEDSSEEEPDPEPKPATRGRGRPKKLPSKDMTNGKPAKKPSKNAVSKEDPQRIESDIPDSESDQSIVEIINKPKKRQAKLQVIENDEEMITENEDENSDDDVVIIKDTPRSGRKNRGRGRVSRSRKKRSMDDVTDFVVSSGDSLDSDYDESDSSASSEAEVLSSDDEVILSSGGGKKNALFSKNKKSKPEDAEIALELLKREMEAKMKEKDLEIQRLKNDLKWKEEQLDDMNTLSLKNMELESKLDEILSNEEAYKKEVKAQTEEKEEREKKKNQPKKDTEDEESPKKSGKDENDGTSREFVKRRSLRGKRISSESGSALKAGTPKRSRRGKSTDVGAGEEETVEGKPKRRRRRKKGGEPEEEEEDIDTLFISDDEGIDALMRQKQKRKSKPDDKKDGDEGEDKEESAEKPTEGENAEEKNAEEGDDKDKGRHNIRKLMTGKKLAEETKVAAKEEKDRRERVKELKKEHLAVTHTDPKTKLPVTTRLVLAFKKDTKQALVEVNTKLIKKLKPHQVEAVEFLWDCLIESIDSLKSGSKGSGTILAHCMGLGKTLSVIATVHTMMTMPRDIKFKRCLIVCPLNTVLNWQYEWQKWLDKKDRIKTHELAGCKDNHSRARLLEKWYKEGGVMIMGYQLFRILVNSNTKSKKKKQIFDNSLLDPGPDVVVCDEGHILKNDGSMISKCMSRIRTHRRIVLTGTPLQNNLIEYHCMVNFVKPNLLGTRKEFGNRFVNPITNGQHTDSSEQDVKIMKRRAHVLHEMLAGCVQRRDYSALTKFLPPKHEYVISVRLTKLQVTLYRKYLEKNGLLGDAFNKVGASLFSDYQNLQRIWTHPWVLKLDEIRQEKKASLELDITDSELETDVSDNDSITLSSSSSSESKDGKKRKRIKSVSESSTSSIETIEDDDEDEKEEELSEPIVLPTRTTRRTRQMEKDNKSKESEETPDKKSKKREKDVKNGDDDSADIKEGEDGVRKAKVRAGEVIRQWQTNSRGNGAVDEPLPEKKKEEAWWAEYVQEEAEKQVELSNKLVLLFDILRMAETFGDKVLIFSQSLLSLDLIEAFLSYKHEEASTQKKKKGVFTTWERDEDYFRMDGSTNIQYRKKYTNTFNDPKNKRMRIFLISTKAGGLGINLDAANRVIIFDASWNPSHDIQSIFRVYRFGQEKNVFVYRLIAQGTMEEKIYERQIQKETLSQRVIDENQMDRHFSSADLRELYTFAPDELDDPDRKEKPTPKLPEDVIMTELLSSRKDCIVGYHEHDSLLEKRPEENLTEDERKAAWDDYEKDKLGLYVNRLPNQHAYTGMPYAHYQYRPLPSVTSSLMTIPRPNYSAGGTTVGYRPMGGPTPGSSSSFSNIQLDQLPKVVQEIVKFNPNISPTDLQMRLQAFLGMHTKFGQVPGFALNVVRTPGRIEIKVQRPPGSLATAVAQQPSSSMGSINMQPPVASSSTSTGGYQQPFPGNMVSALASSAVSSVMSSAPDMPSRLPQPGNVPAMTK